MNELLTDRAKTFGLLLDDISIVSGAICCVRESVVTCKSTGSLTYPPDTLWVAPTYHPLAYLPLTCPFHWCKAYRS